MWWPHVYPRNFGVLYNPELLPVSQVPVCSPYPEPITTIIEKNHGNR